MKYLKNYEMYEPNDDVPILKKYVIWDGPYYLLILQIFEQERDKIQVSIRYRLIDNVLVPTEFQNVGTQLTQSSILYQSDNLDDCVKEIHLMSDQQKYNL